MVGLIIFLVACGFGGRLIYTGIKIIRRREVEVGMGRQLREQSAVITGYILILLGAFSIVSVVWILLTRTGRF